MTTAISYAVRTDSSPRDPALPAATRRPAAGASMAWAFALPLSFFAAWVATMLVGAR